ncbi:MAG: hypothetical protein LBM68_04420 [Bacteroidales bacterium]|jgi:hypothetical protein|nr:hypothetical protein [Bacteroidales bacterium]
MEIIKDFDLLSPKWLDVIFENKNKKYGAYELRNDSSNRHLKAIIIVSVLSLFTLFLPKIVSTTHTPQSDIATFSDDVQVTMINEIEDPPVVEQVSELEGSIPAGVSVIIGEKVKGGDAAGELGGSPDNPLTDVKNAGTPDPSAPLSIADQERARKEQEFVSRVQGFNSFQKVGNNGTSNTTAGNSSTGAASGYPGDPRGSVNGKNVKGSPGNPFGNGDATHLAKPLNTTNCDKQVDLRLKIDSQGNVIDIVAVETALSEQECIKAAKEAARKNKFPADASKSVRYARIVYDYSVSRQ